MAVVRATQVQGPVDSGRGRPFGVPKPETLQRHGYVLTEYLMSGTAVSYEPLPGTTPGLHGHWEVREGPEAPYTTRFYVVRPADPAAFNGVLVVNWQNVTAGADLGIPPREAYRGYAWAGVTTQRVAVDGQPSLGPGFTATSGLRGWDPERYGSLRHPGDAWSYDIFTQAARALLAGSAAGPDPLEGLSPRTVLATGGSQSALRLGSYLNLAQGREKVFHGFLLTVHFGMCPPPPDQPLWTSFAPAGDGLTQGSSRIRDDHGTSVLLLCSETETINNFPVRQPDSATYRFWEMAGTAHASGNAMDEIADVMEGFDLTGSLPDGLMPNTISWDYVSDAALRHLVRWVEHGEQPPSFPPIEVEPGPPAAIRRDAWGNATGGLRLPPVAAPTAIYRGTSTAVPAAALLGETRPASREQLAARYPDRGSYLDVWNGAIDALLAAGLDITVDVERLRAEGQVAADMVFGTR